MDDFNPTDFGNDLPGELADADETDRLLDQLWAEAAETLGVPPTLSQPVALLEAAKPGQRCTFEEWLLSRLPASEGRFVLEERRRIKNELAALRAEKAEMARMIRETLGVFRHMIKTMEAGL